MCSSDLPGCTFVNPEESAEIMTKRAQCRDVIVDYSWKMIFANSKEEFQRLYTSMVGIVMDLGYEEVFEWDLMNAKLQAIYREEALR